MAFQPGRAAAVLVDQYDLTTYFKDAEVSAKSDMGDTSTFGGTAHTKLNTLKDGSVKLSGLFDPATTASAAILGAALGASAASVFTHCPMGTTLGYLTRLISVRASEYTEKQSVAGLVENSATIEADGGIDWGVSLHALAAETSSTNSASVDNAAGTTNGGVGHLHATAVSGTTPTAAIKIQHSTNDSTWADLATFTGLTTSTSSERVTLAASTTVNRYLRAVSTIAGSSPSYTYHVSFARR